MQKRILVYALCLVSIFCITGCEQTTVPEPRKPPADRAWLPEDVDSMVLMEEVLIPSNAPINPFFDVYPPDACNYIHFLRFRLRNETDSQKNIVNTVNVDAETFSPVNMENINAVLVLMPGFLEGANGFEYFGRQLVYMAKTKRDATIEVWAVDRRPNCVENLTGVNKAEKEKDPQVAIDYYWHGEEIDGETFKGHPKDQDLPYLSEFGLRLVINDLYKIITTLVPDQAIRQKKVFVGGHSLAGFITAIFAEWDFDGNPDTTDDAGYKNCAGFIALDTVIASMTQMLDPILAFLSKDVIKTLHSLTEASYYILVQSIRAGILPRFLPLDLAGMSPEAMTMIEIMGMNASWKPDEESSLFDDIPYGKNVEFLINILHSKSVLDFFAVDPRPEDFRYTNEALVGTVFDDNFMPITIMQPSMGFLAGDGAVVQKNFPLPGNLEQIMDVSDLISSMICFKGMFIADDPGDPFGTGPVYSWANFDEIGNTADPLYMSVDGEVLYTTMNEEVTDIQDFSRMLYAGPSNLSEWYFTMRIVVDLVAASFPFGAKYGLNCIHTDKRDEFPPKIEFLAEKGPFTPMMGILPDADMDSIVGYNHFDVLTAAVDRPGHRENEVMMPLINFVLGP